MMALNRREFLLGAFAGAVTVCTARAGAAPVSGGSRPNILFAIADDWSWPHASIYGARGIHTPAFDRVAKSGCLFTAAFTAAPQCSPNRAATLTGRNIWQIGEAGTHNSYFPRTHPVYTDLLEASGYHVGFTGKGWGPGNFTDRGWPQNPAGREYRDVRMAEVPASGIGETDYAGNFDAFLEARSGDQPFCFWYGAKEPHRGYEEGSGAKAGKSPADIAVPGYLPDTPAIRSDLLDYFLEVEWFDAHLGKMLDRLEAMGELENTIVIATGDNGFSFPRAKANLYDPGTHVPFAVQWPAAIAGGQTSHRLTSFIDIAPTLLKAAGLPVPGSMIGTSFLPALGAKGHDGDDTATPAMVLTGRERHSHSRFDNWSYPGRAIRTEDYLYIWNLKPDRWPAGDPEGYHDVDDAPSKQAIIDGRENYPKLFDWSYGKRPEEELYAVKTDPDCLKNLAGDAAHQALQAELRSRLLAALTAQGDPRVDGRGDIFESYPRFGGMRPELGGFAERGKYNPAYQVKE